MAAHPNLRHRWRFAPRHERAYCERCAMPRYAVKGRKRLFFGKTVCKGWTLSPSSRRQLFSKAAKPKRLGWRKRAKRLLDLAAKWQRKAA